MNQALRPLVKRLSGISPPFGARHWKWWRFAFFFIADSSAVAFSYWIAFVLRLDDLTIAEFRSVFWLTLPIQLVTYHVVAAIFRLNRQVWRYANYLSALLILKCTAGASLLALMVNFTFAREAMPPRSVPFIALLISFVLLTITRFSWRAWSIYKVTTLTESRDPCFIYGAGAAGDFLVRHAASTPKFPLVPVGFIDDDPNKRGRLVHGLPVLGAAADLGALAERLEVKTVVVAMHAVPGGTIRSMFERCHELGIKPLIMPELSQSLDSNVYTPREIDIKDLLKRSPRTIDRKRIHTFFSGTTVLVTGAGGSIGSEICRQIVAASPRTLVLFDSSEYNLYAIEQELEAGVGRGVRIIPVLGSITDARLVDEVFRTHAPKYVLHAAAYKHVPMIEANPLTGVVNNLLGTKIVAEAAARHGVEKFLLISTDKAVRPTNVMGCTKRACELVVQSMHALEGSRTKFCAVRFGNVLGSSGSVIPKFLDQIRRGGPVTVTHPDVTRFFMLTSEAVGLVLNTIIVSQGGEIFILNMGEPVRIADMARQLIMLAGHDPDEGIQVVYTGLRPGEKLYEELILEGAEKFRMDDEIFVATPEPFDPVAQLSRIVATIDAGVRGDTNTCLRLLRSLAEYHVDAPPSELEAEPEGPADDDPPVQLH